jgi:hypothetical protein
MQPDIVVETTSPIARLSLVASGMGVTFALQSEPFKGVVARPVADLQIAFVGVLLSRRRVSPSSPLHTFRDILVAAAHRSATLSSLVPGSRGRARSNSGRGNRCSTCRIRRQLAGTWVRPIVQTPCLRPPGRSPCWHDF